MRDRSDDVAALLAELRDSWAKGERPHVEQYLARMPALASDREALLDLIYQEIVMRERHDEPLSLDDFLQRFPHLADDLSRHFEVHKALGDKALLDELTETDDDAFPDVEGFQIRARLGSGTFGVVYRAWQSSLRREVALKLLRDAVAAEPKDKANLVREAQAVAHLRHPNIVQVYEIGEHGGCPFFAMEYVAGGSLEQWLDHAPQPPREAARLIETAARAVHYAHQQNLIHCDLKPANILLQRKSAIGDPKESLSDFDPKITDFGLARQFGASTGLFSGTARGVRAGAGGTLSYMAPEQAGGPDVKIEPPADVYALGAILYEMLTGRPPFVDRSLLEIVLQLRDCDPVPPRSLIPATPRDLETICLHCLHKDPKRRYATAADLADDLDRQLTSKPIVARPVGRGERTWLWSRRNPLVAALTALLIAAVIGGFTGVTAEMFTAWAERDAKETARKAEETAKKAEKARADELEAALNRNRILLAARAYRELDADAANRALDACMPESRDIEWYALKQLCGGPRQVIPYDMPNRLALSGDGRRAAVGRFSSSVHIIELPTGQIVSTTIFDGPKPFSPFGGLLALSPEGNRMAEAPSEGPPLVVWDVSRGKLLWACGRSDFNGSLVGIAFLDGGTKLLTVAQELRNGDPPTGLEFRQYDAASGRLLTTYEGPRRDAGTHCNLSRDGTRVAWMTSAATSFGEAVEVVVCDTLTGKLVSILKGHAKRVNLAAFSADNRRMATASDDGTIKIWDTDSAREVATLNGDTGGVHALAFSPDDNTLAAAGEDRAVRLWDLVRGQLRAVLRGHADAVQQLVFLPDGSGVASVGDDGRVMVWNLDPPGALILRDPNDATNAGCFLPDNTLITAHTQVVDGRLTGRAQFIDLNGRQEPRQSDGWFQYLTRSPNGRRLAAFDSKTVRFLDAETGRSLGAPLSNIIGPMVFGPEGKQLIGMLHVAAANIPGPAPLTPRRPGLALQVPDDAFDPRKFLVAVDTATGAEHFRIAVPDYVASLAATPDGRRVAAGYGDGGVLVFDADTGKQAADFHTPSKNVVALAMRPDGEQLVVAGFGERTALVCDAMTGKERVRLTGHTGAINAVAYSADGRRILTGGEDRTVRLWDATTGQELVTFLDCTKPVRWVAISPDGKRLAAGGSSANGIPGSEVVVWDARPLDAPR